MMMIPLAHSQPPKQGRRFLIIRTDRIGDVVLSTPVLTAIRHSFPGCFIAMLLRPYTAEVVDGHPDLDLILLEEPQQSLTALVQTIRQPRFDTVLLLHPTARLALACRLAGIPHRFGTGYRAYSLLFNHRVYQHRKQNTLHEVDLNLKLAEAAGAHLDHVKFNLIIPELAARNVDLLLRQNGLSPQQPFVILHPGSGGSALNWPPPYFAKLATWLHQQRHLPIVITGTDAEEALITKIVQKAHCPVIRLDGKLSIKELTALLHRARLLITNSTGPLHLAVALGTEVIGLYCPIKACSPVRWGPYQRPDSVLVPEVPYCERCVQDGCRYLNCMELISVEQVLDLAEKKLNLTGVAL